MDIGICVASHVKDIDYIVHAEELGYSHAWLADTQMLWSDCYTALALVADKILPNFDPHFEVIERVAKDIIPNV